jgi:hypothetical protein
VMRAYARYYARCRGLQGSGRRKVALRNRYLRARWDTTHRRRWCRAAGSQAPRRATSTSRCAATPTRGAGPAARRRSGNGGSSRR